MTGTGQRASEASGGPDPWIMFAGLVAVAACVLAYVSVADPWVHLSISLPETDLQEAVSLELTVKGWVGVRRNRREGARHRARGVRRGLVPVRVQPRVADPRHREPRPGDPRLGRRHRADDRRLDGVVRVGGRRGAASEVGRHVVERDARAAGSSAAAARRDRTAVGAHDVRRGHGGGAAGVVPRLVGVPTSRLTRSDG
jgi:hypothetical protein